MHKLKNSKHTSTTMWLKIWSSASLLILYRLRTCRHQRQGFDETEWKLSISVPIYALECTPFDLKFRKFISLNYP